MKSILFVCTHNAGRSQMAQALWHRHAPPDVRAESAGQEPASAPWPEVVEAMAEVGIDISRERPKKLDLEMQLHADWAITLGCGGACPHVPTRVDDWQIPDPHGQPLAVVREIRDDLERRIVDFIGTRLDQIRQDRTAHQLRLARVLPGLDGEFAETHDAEEIRACTDAILGRFDEAPARLMVETIVFREARACLRDNRCDEVLAAR